MKTKRFARLSAFLSLVIAAVLLLPACSDTTDGAPSEIVIGNPTSLTGNFAAAGICSTFGAEQAVADINAAGGVMVSEYNKKLKIKLITVDDSSDENKSAQLAEDLILRSGAKFIISPAGFPQCVATKALVCEKYMVPHTTGVVPLEPTMGLQAAADRPWTYTFMNGFSISTPVSDTSDFRYGKGGYTVIDTWSYMLETYGGQTNETVGFFASDDPDGAGWYAGFPLGVGATQPTYKQVGVDKKIGLFPVNTVDYSANIKAWMDAGVQILWGNSDGPDCGVMLRQMRSMGFRPKMVGAARAALYYGDVSSWGGDLANGVGIEVWGFPTMAGAVGFGNTTPESLTTKWITEKNKPFEQMLPHGYRCVQELAYAIEKAGSLDGTKVQAAMKNMDVMTLSGRVKYDKGNFSAVPVAYGQWFKTDDKFGWTLKIVASKHDFIPVQAKAIFPY
jgi:branched-chain amino acid transport system substrate-binding protein